MSGINVTGDPVPTIPLRERTGFRLSWGAIVAGLVVALSLQIVLGLAGASIGLAAWDPGDRLGGFGVGAAIWAALTILIAMFFGGRTTGRLAGVLSRKDGVLHGVVLWGVGTLLTFWLVSSGLGAVIGGTFGLLGRTAASVAGGAASGVGQAAGAVAQRATRGDLDVGQLGDEIRQVLRETGKPGLSPDSLRAAAQRAGRQATEGGASNQDIVGQLTQVLRQGGEQVDREALVNVLASRTDLSRAEAERVADRLASTAQSVRSDVGALADTLGQRASARAEDVTSGLSEAARWTLLLLGLSLAAATFGAARTAPQ